MNNRYIGALILSPLLVFLFIGGIYLKYLVFILSLMGLYEFYKVIKEKEINSFSIIGYIFCIIYYIYMGENINTEFIFYIIVLATIISLIIPVIDVKYNFIDSAATILGCIYVPVFFSFIVAVNNKMNGNYFVWLIFIASWVGDTSAYYTGKYFGNNKLCPKVSPKKTIEGSIGGLLGSAIGCGIFGFFIINKGVNILLIHFIILGVLSGILSQLGDLVASSIKRYAGVKDYSNLIPGHGGILDRFDSILFSTVAVYYYLNFIIGI
ncbi:phosphatidate cytidylyltransferase [Clostridium rectalis]|uniref:phosphatidate cytidylyltransferase n=1 Tax=Clostridium rectalis TaxID=2040295 RepID=UPI000F63A71B|nr:phosphatidate cytidylyltransferase [Clostridium rectalis]